MERIGNTKRRRRRGREKEAMEKAEKKRKEAERGRRVCQAAGVPRAWDKSSLSGHPCSFGC